MKAIRMVIVPLLALACGASDASREDAVNRDTLTQRQRDSILAGSQIPGAASVGRAMKAADAASARAARADSLASDT
ncbi:MAG: hypothetical protein ACREMN_07770, partial [Gemmatimonadales bacterium]